MTNYMCIDVGGTAIKYAVSTRDGSLSEVRKLKTPKTMEDFLEVISSIVDNSDCVLTGLAISMPGLINSKTGYAVHGGALLFIRELNIKTIISERFPSLRVEIENDGKCAALGEKYYGELNDIDNGIALVLGTAVGGGIIINGELLRGSNLSAGEFSFIRNSPITEKPEDFLALQLSVPLLLKKYSELTDSPLDKLTGELFFEKIHSEDQHALKLIKMYTKKLTQQLFNLQTILDPEIITIGGGISEQNILIDFITQDIDEELARYPIPLIRPNIKQSKLGNKANLLGALAHFIENEHN